MRRKAKTLMVQGVGSHVGKSIIVTALCRIFSQDGYKVSPFKAQNMALNSFVAKEGGEIGMAQAAQARAAKTEPSVDMNPILLKPTSDIGSQVILRGKIIGNMDTREYKEFKKEAIKVVTESLERLREEYEIIIIEGAGSPAEINLKDEDIANMRISKIGEAPVILVGDIDRGGVFAWLWGTIELLDDDEKSRIKGILINKFRGNKSLLIPGIDYLEKSLKKEVLGVIPFFHNIRILDEDSLSLQEGKGGSLATKGEKIRIEIIRLPHISNFTDFTPLEEEPDVNVRYISIENSIGDCDILIIPGSKNSLYDLSILLDKGFKEMIDKHVRKGGALIGICGGYQMLGEKIIDSQGTESHLGEMEGLGYLDLVTTFSSDKVTSRVLAKDLRSGLIIKGYEIHHGRTTYGKNCLNPFQIIERDSREVSIEDGAMTEKGNIWGTYIHGLFDNPHFRRTFINEWRERKGYKPPLSFGSSYNEESEYDKLAHLFRSNADMEGICRILKSGL